MIQKISKEEAKSIIDSVMPHYLIDVREQDEYEEGHIKGARLVPLSVLESICDEKIPDKEKPLLLHCQSGRRSAKAAILLDQLGYQDIHHFGGISDWKYDIEQ